jgi:peptide chain release factor 1
MLERIEEVERRYRELEEELAQPGAAADPRKLRDLGLELSGLREIVETHRRLVRVRSQIEQNEALLEDEDREIRELARAELAELEPHAARLEAEVGRLLRPQDPNDVKNVVLEIRAGTGGDEASLFAADLFRMYTRYAESAGWRIEPLSSSETEAGGLKEVIAAVNGRGAFGRLKYESGVHRVQRVPVTEAQGRIHTSTVTVAVLPEAEEVDVHIDEKDLRVDRFRSSGPGGQSVNTTDSAIRITHLPTGLVVSCQDEKSQHKNKARALTILRSRLFEMEQERLAAERGETRRGQIGSGERSERIRTYNFPQNRVTDHRVGITLHKLDKILEGDIEDLLEQVADGLAGESS